MSMRRIGVLFLKDLRFGSRNYIFVFALVMPVVISLLLGLMFGTIFSDMPKVGIVDAGNSRLAADLLTVDFMNVQAFPTEEAMLTAMESGGIEVGLSLPANFDAQLQSGEQTDLTFYVWGQSLVKNRAIASAAITDAIVELSGRETPITVEPVLVGDREAQSWQQRLLPLVVLMSVMLGAILVPATSMVEEKLQRTLTAVTTTPMSMGEVFLTKGLMGVALSIFSGFTILTLNGGWGSNPLLLLLVVTMGGVAASAFGVFMGSRVKDVQTLFAINKSIGIFLYAPALISLFPDSIPQWIARLFPTYYIVQPVLDISQRGAGLADIAVNLGILGIITAALIALLGVTADRLQVQVA
ncbi:MAG: ABC transporter permease [Chloroflexi bacterium]|nr:ABC transporter permease [Chloroflexota bacterium]